MSVDCEIFPAEALLLGECAGEYRRSEHVFFVDLARRRLATLMPALHGAKIFEGLGREEDSRRFLADRLFPELREFLALSPLDRRLGLIEDFRHYELALEAALSSQEWYSNGGQEEESHGQRDILKKVGRDDPDRLVEVLEELAHKCGFSNYFELGRSFGHCLGAAGNVLYQLSETHQNSMHPILEEEFSLQRFIPQEEIAQLLRAEIVSKGHVAKATLEKVLGELPIPYFGRGEDWLFRVTELASEALGSLWMAFGEVLGAVRQQDLEARWADAKSATPRPYRVDKTSSRDDICLALETAERELALELRAGRAEMIVRNLSPAIEALSQAIWRQEFCGKPGELLGILQRKIKNENKIEERFASTALSLYKSYRNQAMHQMKTFRCTHAEARYFTSAIRMLLELSERLQSSQ